MAAVRRGPTARGGTAVQRASQRRWLPSVAVAASVVLVALGSSWAAAATPAADTELDVVLDSTQHWVGTNDVLLSVYDSEGTSLAESAHPLLLELSGPSGQRLAVEPAIEQFATYGRRLYRARVPLGEVGRWEVRASADVAGRSFTGSTILDVSADVGTPALGSSRAGR